MHTLAESCYLDSRLGVDEELPRAGSGLENPYVYDAAARELKAMADKGWVAITAEHTVRAGSDLLIDRLRFTRLN